MFLNVFLDFVSENIETLGKQNSLFPLGPVIKYLLYYPVPDTSIPLLAVSIMALPVVKTMAKEDEVVMKGWIENVRPVRQRTVTEAKQLKIKHDRHA